MNGLIDGVAALVHALRIADPGQWVLRLLCLLSLVGAGLVCLAWFPLLASVALLVVIGFAGVLTVVRPDSLAPLAGIGTVVLWWLAGAAEATWWQAAVVAGLLAVFHLSAGHCAAAPSYAAITGASARRVVAWTLGYLAVVVVGVALVLAAVAVPDDVVPRGLPGVAAGLLALVGGAVAVVRAVGGPKG